MRIEKELNTIVKADIAQGFALPIDIEELIIWPQIRTNFDLCLQSDNRTNILKGSFTELLELSNNYLSFRMNEPVNFDYIHCDLNLIERQFLELEIDNRKNNAVPLALYTIR